VCEKHSVSQTPKGRPGLRASGELGGLGAPGGAPRRAPPPPPLAGGDVRTHLVCGTRVRMQDPCMWLVPAPQLLLRPAIRGGKRGRRTASQQGRAGLVAARLQLQQWENGEQMGVMHSLRVDRLRAARSTRSRTQRRQREGHPTKPRHNPTRLPRGTQCLRPSRCRTAASETPTARRAAGWGRHSHVHPRGAWHAGGIRRRPPGLYARRPRTRSSRGTAGRLSAKRQLPPTEAETKTVSSLVLPSRQGRGRSVR
jgi:hypothetical protein